MAPAPTGVLRLRAVRLGGRTVLTEVQRSAPFHLGQASYRQGDGTAEVIVQQAGPGIFPSDHLVTEITVEAGACLIVRGQSATKLYPSVDGDEGFAQTVLRVAAGAALSFLPGELIPFRDARYRQVTEIELEPGARLALREVITPGRIAMGERDAYQLLDLSLRIRLADRLILVERSRLEPVTRPLSVIGRHGPYTCVGSLYLFGYPDELLDDEEPHESSWAGHGTVDGLSLVRVLAETAQAVNERISARVWRATAAVSDE